jgi:putative ABC transport system ATP-binding protein
MIELKNIAKTFNAGSAAEIHALRDINLTIHEKEFVVVVGSNGSGKSTLLNIIAGNDKPGAGKILFDNKEVNNLQEHQRSRWIARIFQNPLMGTAPELTILENFRLASLRTKDKTLIIGTKNKFRQTVRDKISMLHLGLENKVDQLMGTLSGGQRQALTLLMAVMDDIKILLMDEPTAALDPKTSETLMKLAQKIIADFGLTAILVTHQMKDVVRYGNRIIQIAEGSIKKDLTGIAKAQLQLQDVYSWFE